MDLLLAGNTEKWLFLRFAEKRFFWPKILFSQTNTQNPLKDSYLFGKMVLLSLHNLPGHGYSMARNKK